MDCPLCIEALDIAQIVLKTKDLVWQAKIYCLLMHYV